MDVAEVVVVTSVEVWHGDEDDEDMMMMTVDLSWGVAFGGGDVDGGSMMLMGVSAGGGRGDSGVRSGRSGNEKHFWAWPENSPEKFSGGGRRWPEVGRRWLPEMGEEGVL
ncbi:hypothetical protein Tco_0055092 [Tanacetum coccineum]